MSERRWNPVLGEWVLTATHRQERTFLPPKDFCPLCPTQPGGFPTEIPHSDFEIAVFENRFPSLVPEPPDPAIDATDLNPVLRSHGACEVVVYTAEHDTTLAAASVEKLERLIAVWAQRTLELGARDGVDYVFCFENKGTVIGVTLHHPHGQIYAYPFVPPILAREAHNGARHRDETGGCLWCDLNRQELADGRRIVAREDGWLAGIPFAARWPFEVHLVPDRHIGWLHELRESELVGLARLLKRLLVGYDDLFGFSLPYIMAIHQRPTDGAPHDGFHLHFEFLPPYRTADKLKYLAGSETAAGVFINDTLPEETAPRLRELIDAVQP